MANLPKNSELQTFNGTDIGVIFSIPISEPTLIARKPFKLSSNVHTITVSSTASISPVRRCGESRPRFFGKGARTVAGTLIFIVAEEDPFAEIFAQDALSSSSTQDDTWHIDGMPAFDIILTAQNETGGVAAQVIEGVRIINWGTAYSVDDMYQEYTYTYVAESVTPFLASNVEKLLANFPKTKTPDDLAFPDKLSTVDRHKLSFGSLPTPNRGETFVSWKSAGYTDPSVPYGLATEIDKNKQAPGIWTPNERLP